MSRKVSDADSNLSRERPAPAERALPEWCGRYWKYLEELLFFPTISAEKKPEPFRACVSFLDSVLKALGFEVSWCGESRCPSGFASLEVDPDLAWTVLYQHYDVQPAGDESLWRSPPFIPTLFGDRLFARGAQDNKGQLCYVLAALGRLIAERALGCNILLILDGEEECGSPLLPEVLAARLPSHPYTRVISFDGIMPDQHTLGLVIGCRGFFAVDLTLETGSRDVHSGYYGGIAPNPIHILTASIDSLRKQPQDAGRIPQGLNAALKETAQLLSESGLYFLNGSSPEELFRKSTITEDIEIVRIMGGPDGFSTVIPCSATARVIVRPTAGRNAEERLTAVMAGVQESLPSGSRLSVRRLCEPITGFIGTAESNVSSRFAAAGAAVGRRVAQLIDGGCSPGICRLHQILRVPCMVTGTGLAEDCIHAPNESFSMKQFVLGYDVARNLLSAIPEQRNLSAGQ